MSDSVKTKPGRWLYLIGVLLIIAGIAVSVAMAAGGAVTALRDAPKVQVPGKSTVELTKAGTYTITFTADAQGKPVTSSSAYNGLTFTVSDESGSPVTLTKVGGITRVFKIAKGGTYTLDAEYPSSDGAAATVAVMGSAGIHTGAITALFWVFVIAGAAVIVLTAVLRRKARRGRAEQ